MIRFFLRVYIAVLVITFIVDMLPQFRDYPWVAQLKRFTGPVTEPVKKFLPPDLPIDLSPLLVGLGIEIFIRIF
jgi:uncharacterized protein YggT (Ycf19 family)